MGVSGSGKSSVGIYLAKTLSIPFYDADYYHSDSNIQKMKKGQSLNDSDRIPWLKLLSSNIKDWNSKGDAVLACSALKEKYRLLLSKNNEVTFIFLDGSVGKSKIFILIIESFLLLEIRCLKKF